MRENSLYQNRRVRTHLRKYRGNSRKKALCQNPKQTPQISLTITSNRNVFVVVFHFLEGPIVESLMIHVVHIRTYVSVLKARWTSWVDNPQILVSSLATFK